MNLKAKGVLPVAILTTDDFNASDTDDATVRLGDPTLPGVAAPIGSSLQDVDRDGDLDLVLRFRIPDLTAANAIDADSLVLMLTGATVGGAPIQGMDQVKIVP